MQGPNTDWVYKRVSKLLAKTLKCTTSPEIDVGKSEGVDTDCVQKEQETGKEGRGRGWVLGVSGADILRDT